jgi:hypothetical protein
MVHLKGDIKVGNFRFILWQNFDVGEKAFEVECTDSTDFPTKVTYAKFDTFEEANDAVQYIIKNMIKQAA